MERILLFEAKWGIERKETNGEKWLEIPKDGNQSQKMGKVNDGEVISKLNKNTIYFFKL